MPTYQYACTNESCAHRFEAVQSFSDTSLSTCPVCEGGLRKLFSSVGVVFKGSGFYRTDSRTSANGKGPEHGESRSKDSAAASSESSGSSDSGSAKKESGGSDSTSSSGSSDKNGKPKSAAASGSTGKAAASTG
ncbi:MAG: FmdB family zinc ribbon protein [Mycobacteriales bacterium]